MRTAGEAGLRGAMSDAAEAERAALARAPRSVAGVIMLRLGQIAKEQGRQDGALMIALAYC